MLIGDHHFSGFGVDEVEEVTLLLLDPQYRERFLLGRANGCRVLDFLRQPGAFYRAA